MPRQGVIGTGFTALALAAAPAAAATTPAGTRIENTAALSAGTDRVASNTVVMTVDELLDVTVVADHPQLAVAAPDTVLPVGFVVTNTGNASAAFTLLATADRGAEPVAPDASITLAPGESRHVVVGLRAGASGTTVSLAATAAKGHGAPGTVVAGAVIGQTGASATARTVLVDGADAGPRLEKFQSVLAADGSARPRPGAIITYRLEAHFTGPTPDVAIADAVPAGTVFVPGSITLDGRTLTDAADGDAAAFDGTTVRIALGDVPVAAVRTIQFQTRIQ
ncbi:hypothetical protein Q5H91_09050 [Sphingomonas sp. KR1UV-12]|uniref:DUF11 domain-containing protein n=1 Tax=Sphingomonas aurea TaxID=3063994 RepID=A0ABT9EK83_9SPHN|nr:hypothetical protein [Sphingomonas sp. KR1UV-12]MDP1027359.1 hypothetical protein [Sphingomonas sp. KR1UV-12]